MSVLNLILDIIKGCRVGGCIDCILADVCDHVPMEKIFEDPEDPVQES